MKRLVVLAAAITLTGCVSSGTQVSEAQIHGFHRGTTTEQQVIAELGQPQERKMNNDGSKVDTYIFTHASPKAVDFIPIVGTLAGGANAKSKQVAFVFDKSGVLKSYSSTVGQTDMRTGLLN